MMPNWYAKAVGLEFGLVPETGKHREADTFAENQIEDLIVEPQEGACFLDSFSSFNHLTQRQKKSPIWLLRSLYPKGRFSVFEATESNSIAKSFSKLSEWGWIKNLGGQYPWIEVEVTEKGAKALRKEAKT